MANTVNRNLTPAQLIMRLIEKCYPLRPVGDGTSNNPEVEITIGSRYSNIKLWLKDGAASQSCQEIATFNRPLKYEEIKEIIKAITTRKKQIAKASYEYCQESQTTDGILTLEFSTSIDQLKKGEKTLSCGYIELSIIFKCELREHQEIMEAISRDYSVIEPEELKKLRNASEKPISLSVRDYLSVLNPRLIQNPAATIEEPECGVFNTSFFSKIQFVNFPNNAKGTTHTQINEKFLIFTSTTTSTETGEITMVCRSIPLDGELSLFTKLDTRQIIYQTIGELKKDNPRSGFCLNVETRDQAIEILSCILYRETKSEENGPEFKKTKGIPK